MSSLKNVLIILIIFTGSVHAQLSSAGCEPLVIRVEFSKMKLSLVDCGVRELVSFPVALPAVTLRLPASGEVRDIVLNPIWYPTEPTRSYYKATRKMDLPKAIQPGDPRNAMGQAKIGINFFSSWINSSVVIHGTNDPSSIGKRISRGCIRMQNKDVLELVSLIRGRKTFVLFE